MQNFSKLRSHVVYVSFREISASSTCIRFIRLVLHLDCEKGSSSFFEAVPLLILANARLVLGHWNTDRDENICRTIYMYIKHREILDGHEYLHR